MNVNELESLINSNKVSLDYIKEKKDELEQIEFVKNYLMYKDSINEKEKYQQFLNELDIGEDGTVFSKYIDVVDKSSSNFHFGLSITLKYALGFIQRFNYEEFYNVSGYFRILYDDFQKYLDNAIKILNDMNYYDGDRLVDNCYGLEIYENPKNYSVVNFRELLPLDSKQFKNNYNVDSVIVGAHNFVSFNRNITLLDSDIERLNSREYEAFFGIEAQRILGYNEPKVLRKNR